MKNQNSNSDGPGHQLFNVSMLATFPDENPNPVLCASCDGIILYANKASANLLHAWHCRVGQRLPEPWCQTAGRISRSRRPGQAEAECNSRVLLLTFAPIAPANSVNIYAVDITELKQTEAELRRLNEILEQRIADRTVELERAHRELSNRLAECEIAAERIREQAGLLDLAHDVIITRDSEDRVLFVNQAGEHLLGKTQAEAAGCRLTELLDLDVAQVESAKRILFERERWMGELNLRPREGKELIVESRWVLLKDDRGAPKGILSFCTDVTEKKKLEAQFLRAQRLESIGTLAGGVAHDLNNILAPILMSAAVLRCETKPAVFEKTLRTIEGCAQRGTGIVRQLLTFARGMAGERMVLQPSHLIKDVVHLARETFPKSVSIVSDVPSDLCPVLGDPTQLHQVLLNLCLNARDAMPNGGTLSVTSENLQIDEIAETMYPEARAGHYVVLKISDTGQGIPPAILENIFDPFFTTKEPGRGTGLGLSTALGIVKGHGGFITVYSELGRGTVFKVHLPATQQTGARVHELEASSLPAGRGELILVVDDETAIRDTTRTILERHGYKVATAQDGIEGITEFAKNRDQVKAVLTDIMMPSMDGVMMLRTLRRINPAIKVLVSSGWGIGLDSIRVPGIEELKIHHFLPKPYTATGLLKALHELLRE